MTPDVNVLVAASRSDHPHHAVAHAWLVSALEAIAGGASFTVFPMVLASFIRLVTNPRVFHLPTPLDATLKFADTVLGTPGVKLAAVGPEWPILRQLCEERQLQANAIPDAWLAAATIHAGEHLVSFDRDFRALLGRSQFTLLQ